VFEQRFCDRTLSGLDQACAEALERLVADDGAESVSGRALLAELKADPGQVGLETLLREVDKLGAMPALGLPAELFTDASEKLVEAWRARAIRSYRMGADERRGLSPLFWTHINLYGRFRLDMNTRLDLTAP
jgi:hypothetical protein